MQKFDKAHHALNRALARYDRRERAYMGADFGSTIWFRGSTSALAMVKQARDLAGRLEAVVYDGVAL